MFKNTVAAVLVSAITCLSVTAPAGNANQGQFAQAVKAKVQKIGVSERRKVRVKLRDGSELRGYLSNIGSDSFTVTDSATRKPTTVSYEDVGSVTGNGLSTLAKVLIISGIGLAIVVVIVAVHGTHPLGGGFKV